MDIKKLAPWNWFKDEEVAENKALPVLRPTDWEYPASYSLGRLHQEIDRIFDLAFRNFARPFEFAAALPTGFSGAVLKPHVDIAANDKEYTVTVEVPGVDEDDIKLELVNNSLIVRGEKKQESERQGSNYYRVERSYGSFQRVLSLPEDVNYDGVNAVFRKGVLSITLPRKAEARREGKLIEIKKAA